MTRKRWSSALLIVVMSFMAEGGNPPLNEAASWEPMGAVPVTVSREKAEPAIRFTAERGEAKSCRIWPLYFVREPDALRHVIAIRFEMKYLPSGGSPAAGGAIILPKLSDGSGGNLPFVMPPPGKWSFIEVKFNRSPAEMALIRTIQILVNSRSERMNVLVRHLALVTAEGKSFDFQAPAVKAKVQEDPRHKLRPAEAPVSFAAAPGEKHRYCF